MTDRRLPTRTIPTTRQAQGSAGQGVGWLQPLADRMRGLRAQFEGLHDRLTSPLADGVPSAVTGELLFKANTLETQSVNVAFEEQPAVLAPTNCNPIIKAGQTYRVPVTFSPPGVFMAHNLVVVIEAGVVNYSGQQRPYIRPVGDYRQANNSGAMLEDPASGNLVFSVQQQVWHAVDDALFAQQTYLPFFWNIVDEKSGRQYSQDWLPSGLLMNSRFSELSIGRPSDGEVFEFDTPWLFERDAQVSFQFRPIMDLYQIASSSVGPKQATVRVEFHGNRYYTRQDVLKEGAKL